jgi:hypothetical protein
MKPDKAAKAAQPSDLTGDEAITLRRVAFGESEVRTLRPADVQRLLDLRLIAAVGDTMALTNAGRSHYDSLPRATFAAKSNRYDSR